MFSLKRACIALAGIVLAACGDDRSVNPTSEFVDGNGAAITTGGTLVAQYSLVVGQTLKINPKTTTRTNRLKWSSSNSTVASVNSTGTVTARTSGNATVQVSGNGVLENYAVTVTAPVAPKVTSFSLQPKTGISLTSGQSQQFAASATWSDGMQYPITVSYTATGGTISGTGLFTAGNLAGTFMVVATCACATPAIADTAFVNITAPQLTKLTVSPKTVSLAAGASQQFAVTASWNTGATTVPPVTWSASGGTVSSTGAYVAPSAAGTYQVIVAHTNGTVRDTAVVTVGGGNTTTATTLPSTFGPGANAPAWSNKTVYPQELFNSPIPVHYAGENAAGFKGWQGFDGAWGNIYTPTRVSYPTVSTPLGTKPVLQITYPGSTQAVAAVNGASAVWPTDQPWSVRVAGTWSGNLVFERSADGITWTPVTLRGVFSPGAGTSLSGTQTSVNGVWASDDANVLAGGRFRVRATAWASGSANVTIGMQGGAASARMSAGAFTGKPTRFYTRVLVFLDPNWSNGGNAGTKFFFFSQDQGNNHYVNLFGESASTPVVGLQGASSRNVVGSTATANGNWMDVEILVQANVPGQSNGIARAWINGVEYLNAQDVLYFVSGTTAGFPGLFFDPTYGGGEAPPPRNVFVRIAGWYRESAP